MEDHFLVRQHIRLPLIIPVDPYLKDRHFEGRVILPAAKILHRWPVPYRLTALMPMLVVFVQLHSISFCRSKSIPKSPFEKGEGISV
ncbi:MAG: hypothetical protein ACLP9S_00845 [Syntrophales bacterium]|jgi:hypothetical protein